MGTKDNNGRRQALCAAVDAIYFDDSSDFRGALWDVVRALDPNLALKLEENGLEAYEELHPELPKLPNDGN